MESGYYLSTYLSVNKLGYLYDYFFRCNQNMTLWYYDGGKIEVVTYWKLDRNTEGKGHCNSFFSKDDALSVISSCLAECNVSLEDIKEIWGTPELDSKFLSFWSFNKNIADHSINHLYTLLLQDTKNFYTKTQILMAVDSIVDNVIDKDAFNKKFYGACISIKGNLSFEPVYSPGAIWEYATQQTGWSIEELQAMLYTCQTTYYITELPKIQINNHKSMERGYQILDKLYSTIMNINHQEIVGVCSTFDPTFTQIQNKIGMYVKILKQLTIEIMEVNIETLCEKYKLDLSRCLLGISDDNGINEIVDEYLMHKYGFEELISAPFSGDTALSIGIGLRGFSLRLGRKLSCNVCDMLKDRTKRVITEEISDNQFFSQQRKERLKQEINPWNLSREIIGYLCLFEKMLSQYNLTEKEDCLKIQAFADTVGRNQKINIEQFFKK